MPLVRGSSNKAREKNVKTLIGEVGKSPHVNSRKQAIRIAYEVQRRSKRKK